MREEHGSDASHHHRIQSLGQCIPARRSFLLLRRSRCSGKSGRGQPQWWCCSASFLGIGCRPPHPGRRSWQPWRRLQPQRGRRMLSGWRVTPRRRHRSHTGRGSYGWYGG